MANSEERRKTRLRGTAAGNLSWAGIKPPWRKFALGGELPLPNMMLLISPKGEGRMGRSFSGRGGGDREGVAKLATPLPQHGSMFKEHTAEAALADKIP